MTIDVSLVVETDVIFNRGWHLRFRVKIHFLCSFHEIFIFFACLCLQQGFLTCQFFSFFPTTDWLNNHLKYLELVYYNHTDVDLSLLPFWGLIWGYQGSLTSFAKVPYVGYIGVIKEYIQHLSRLCFYVISVL